STTDLDTLYELAAESLGTLDERSAFLSGKSTLVVGDMNRVLQSGDDSAASFSPSLVMSVGEDKSAPKMEIHPSPACSRQVESVSVHASTKQSRAKESSSREAMKSVVRSGPSPSVQLEATPSQLSDLSINSRLEEVLGKQPENLAGYLKQKPPQVNEVIYAFAAATDALVALYADKNMNLGLTPESICFDRLGRAQIRVSSATVVPGSTMDGAMGSPRYAAPEIFAEQN